MDVQEIIEARLRRGAFGAKLPESLIARVVNSQDPRIEGKLIRLVKDDLSFIPIFSILEGELTDKRFWLPLSNIKVTPSIDPVTGERIL